MAYSPYTLQQSINWSQAFIQGSPLSAWTGGEPGTTAANMILSTVSSAPFTWGWNRAEYTALSLASTVQDYNNIPITDFNFLEKVTLKTPDGKYAYELKDVYNTNALGVSVAAPAEPKSVSVKTIVPGTSISLRFLAIPDKAYNVVLTYQKFLPEFTSLTDPWPIPSYYKDVFNNLFLAEAFQSVEDDQNSQRYRMRGVAALLAKAEGLTEMQRSAFLAQYLSRDAQHASQSLRTQQGVQARGN